MSYLNSLQKYRDMMEYGRGELPESVSTLTQLPPDQSQNIFNYTQGKEQAEIGMQAVAPFAAVAGTDLLRRGAKFIPAIKDLQTALGQGGEFADKVASIVGKENIANFLKDPEGSISKLASDNQEKILQAIADRFGTGAAQVGEGAAQVGQKLSGLAESIPSAEDLGSMAGRFAQGLTGAIGQGISQSVFGPPAPTAPPTGMVDAAGKPILPTPPEMYGRQAGVAEPYEFDSGMRQPFASEEDFDRAFQADLGAPVSSHPAQAGQVETEGQGVSDLFGDDADLRELAQITASNRAMMANILYQQGVAQPPDIMPSEGEGEVGDIATLRNQTADTQEMLNTSKKMADSLKYDMYDDETGGDFVPGAEPEAETFAEPETAAEDLEAKIGAQKVESSALESAIQKGASGSADFGADGLAKTLAKVGGDEAPELSAGLGVGDFIPGLGLAFDAASIGGIIGAAVDYYNEKAKQEKAEEEESQREDAIQQDIAQEQNELVGEGRNASVVQATSNERQQQSSLPLPISQSGTD